MKKLLKFTLALTLAALASSLRTNAAAAEAEDPAPAALTNAAATNVSSHGTITIGKDGHQIMIEPGRRYQFPPEVMNRFTPEQVVEYERARYSRSAAEEVLVPLGFFAGMAIIVALVTAYRMKRTRMIQETIRLMVEKGAPIPPELLLPPEPRKRPRSDLRSGLVWCGIGVALLVYLSGLENRLWALGLIPLLIGVAHLVAWKIESKKVQ